MLCLYYEPFLVKNWNTRDAQKKKRVKVKDMALMLHSRSFHRDTVKVFVSEKFHQVTQIDNLNYKVDKYMKEYGPS